LERRSVELVKLREKPAVTAKLRHATPNISEKKYRLPAYNGSNESFVTSALDTHTHTHDAKKQQFACNSSQVG